MWCRRYSPIQSTKYYRPVDTIANMLTGIHDKVLQTQQQQQRTLNARTNRLRIAGSNLSKRVNQLLESIELDEQSASHKKLEQELYIRNQAAWTMATISILAVILVLVFFAIIWRDITRSNHYRKELEKAKLYAENLLVAREKLMLTITHDIKAPAGSIIGYIDLLIRLVKEQKGTVLFVQHEKFSPAFAGSDHLTVRLPSAGSRQNGFTSRIFQPASTV